MSKLSVTRMPPEFFNKQFMKELNSAAKGHLKHYEGGPWVCMSTRSGGRFFMLKRGGWCMFTNPFGGKPSLIDQTLAGMLLTGFVIHNLMLEEAREKGVMIEEARGLGSMYSKLRHAIFAYPSDKGYKGTTVPWCPCTKIDGLKYIHLTLDT